MTCADLDNVAAFHAGIFGPGRFARTAYRLREGDNAVSDHCRIACRNGVLVSTVTMTPIDIGADHGHWLLGPLAVRADEANRGLGQRLIEAALASVADRESKTATVILVGDLAYYKRVGFNRVPAAQIELPGPVDPARLLIWRGPHDDRPVPSGRVQPPKRLKVSLKH